MVILRWSFLGMCFYQWRLSLPSQSQSQSHIATDGKSVSLGVKPHLGPATRYLLLCDSYGLVLMGRPLWWDYGSVFIMCCGPLPEQSFLGLSPFWLETIFYCLRLESSLFVASYDSQGHGGGIWPRLHMGDSSTEHTFGWSTLCNLSADRIWVTHFYSSDNVPYQSFSTATWILIRYVAVDGSQAATKCGQFILHEVCFVL
jgi:hypothetical protein